MEVNVWAVMTLMAAQMSAVKFVKLLKKRELSDRSQIEQAMSAEPLQLITSNTTYSQLQNSTK